MATTNTSPEIEAKAPSALPEKPLAPVIDIKSGRTITPGTTTPIDIDITEPEARSPRAPQTAAQPAMDEASQRARAQLAEADRARSSATPTQRSSYAATNGTGETYKVNPMPHEGVPTYEPQGRPAAANEPHVNPGEKPPVPATRAQATAHAETHDVGHARNGEVGSHSAAERPKLKPVAAEVHIKSAPAAANDAYHTAPEASTSRAVGAAKPSIPETPHVQAAKVPTPEVHVAGNAANTTEKAIVEDTVKGAAKSGLKFLGPVVTGVIIAGDTVEGIERKDPKLIRKALLEGAGGVVVGAAGTAVAGPVGGVGGAVAGAALGSKLNDAIEGTVIATAIDGGIRGVSHTVNGPLTDRSGKVIPQENNYGISRQHAGTQYDRLVAEARARDEAQKAAKAAAAAAAAPHTEAAAAPAAKVAAAEAPHAQPVPAAKAAPATAPHAETHAKPVAHAAATHKTDAQTTGDKSPNDVARQLAADIKIHMQANTPEDRHAAEIKGKLAENKNVTVDDIRKAYGLTQENHAQHVAATEAIKAPPPVVAHDAGVAKGPSRA